MHVWRGVCIHAHGSSKSTRRNNTAKKATAKSIRIEPNHGKMNILMSSFAGELCVYSIRLSRHRINNFYSFAFRVRATENDQSINRIRQKGCDI